MIADRFNDVEDQMPAAIELQLRCHELTGDIDRFIKK